MTAPPEAEGLADDIAQLIWDDDSFQDGLEMIMARIPAEQFTAYTTILGAIKKVVLEALSTASSSPASALKEAEAKPKFPAPCGVCGRPAELCVPLTICPACKDSPKADELRAWQKSEYEKAQRGEPSIYDMKPDSAKDALKEVEAKVKAMTESTIYYCFDCDHYYLSKSDDKNDGHSYETQYFVNKESVLKSIQTSNAKDGAEGK